MTSTPSSMTAAKAPTPTTIAAAGSKRSSTPGQGKSMTTSAASNPRPGWPSTASANPMAAPQPTKYGAYTRPPASGVSAAAVQRQRHWLKYAEYRLKPTYSSQKGAMSQVLMTSRPPSARAARPCVHGERRVTPRLRTCAAAMVSTSSSNGRAMKCGCRSLKSAEKNGNSLMPSGFRFGMTREALNHQNVSVGGQTPLMTLLPKCLGLMPSASPASTVITPRDRRNSKKVDRVPQNSANSAATPEPAPAHGPCTPTAPA